MTAGTKIVLLFDNNVAEYQTRIHDAAARAARSLGFPLESENLHASRRPIAEVLKTETAAGFILTAPLSDDRHVLGLIDARGLPCVRIAPMLDPERGCTVVMDEYDAARAITDLLLRKGHRRIGFVRGPRVHLVSLRRYNGYAAAMGGKGLRLDPSLIAQGDFSRQSGREVAAALFAMRPTAIFASNDEMAVGVLDAALAGGIDVPRDVSLVGFDDNVIARTVRPRLTSVRQPLEEMGEAACKLLVDRIRRPSTAGRHEQVPFQIVERESVADYVAA
jgi:LacI family transcriptional regulator